jgi:uncharacterized LabA/DUF88 family protein
VTKPGKEFSDSEGRPRVKRTVDAMEVTEHVREVVLFSGGGDLRSLVQAVQRRGGYSNILDLHDSLARKKRVVWA